MIPYLEGRELEPCHYRDHKGHKNALDCYLETWREPPLPWFQRAKPISDLSKRRAFMRAPVGRAWHLCIGIRRDSGDAQSSCNVGTGPGPFLWREKPTLNWDGKGPREWFCRRCVAEWTRSVDRVTVQINGVRVTKKSLEALVKALPTNADYMILKPTNVEDSPALLAEVHIEDQRESWVKKLLVVGDGVVELESRPA